MAGSLALFFLFFPFSERHFEHLETSWQKHKEETGRNREQMKKRENSTPGIGTFVPSPTVCTCRHTLTGWILISTLSSTCRLKDSADSKRAFPCILNDALLKNQTEKKNRKRIQIYSTLDIECVRVCVCIKLRFILHMEVFSFYLQGHTGKPFFYLFFFIFLFEAPWPTVYRQYRINSIVNCWPFKINGWFNRAHQTLYRHINRTIVARI